MTTSPALLRTVTLARGYQMLAQRGIVPPRPLQWPSLYPYYPPSATVPWSWLDAMAWCQDAPADVITQVGVGVSPADGTITGWDTQISTDGLSVGVRPRIVPAGMTPGITYVVTIHLTCAGKDITVQVRMPVTSLDALPPYDPTKATLNGDVALIGGFPYPIGASA